MKPPDWKGVPTANRAPMIQTLAGHPYAVRFLQKVQASGNNRVYTPEDVLGERLMRMGGLLASEYHYPGFTIASDMKGVGHDRFDSLAIITCWAIEAHPYLWTEEVRATVRQLEVPRCVLSPKLLPDAKTWHTFETGIQLGGELEYDGRHFINGSADALLLVDAGIGFNMFQFGEMKDAETDEDRPCVVSASFKYGQTFPDDFDETHVSVLTGALLLCSFLASPYIPKHRRLPSRAVRRELARAGQKASDDDHVTFVILRQPVARKHDQKDDPKGVEWKHRWLVRGHIRAQWYPSEQAHRLVWIAPYLKGPEDAPMLTHAYKVAR